MIGQRYTKTRKKIFDSLFYFNKPVTVKEIFNLLKMRHEKVNLASIYRNLELMNKSSLLNIILFGEGKKRYELKNSDSHHHHFFCENCGIIEDVKINEELLLNKINRSRFLIKEHKLEFFGLCPDCQ